MPDWPSAGGLWQTEPVALSTRVCPHCAQAPGPHEQHDPLAGTGRTIRPTNRSRPTGTAVPSGGACRFSRHTRPRGSRPEHDQ